MLSDRRRFLRRAFDLGLSASLLSPLGGLDAAVGGSHRHRGLKPVRDAASGRTLLRLPEGFRYFSFGWAGAGLSGGGVIPAAADGMGLVAASGSRLTFIRNQEVVEVRGAFAAKESAFDPACGGGCVRLMVDVAAERLIEAQPGLSGTLANCAGGATPWGTWLSCEEIVITQGDPQLRPPSYRKSSLSQAHGWVFEVDASGPARARAIEPMGLFRHEAVAVDPASGIVYLTEDRDPEAGFYRFIPSVRGNLHRGGELEMLAAVGAPDVHRGVRVGQRWDVRWVPIAEPTRGHSPGTLDQGGVVAQGLAAGATRFLRLEGCLVRSDGVWFTSTSGGDTGGGQVWRLDSAEQQLQLMFEVGDRGAMDYPDNICEGPGSRNGGNAGMVICEDSLLRTRQRLKWLGRDGRLLTLAENITQIGRVDYGASEWAGCCVSPDGKWLFANIYKPGFSVAITGPWDEWLRA
jgi:secreted PhoX family phosphatase